MPPFSKPIHVIEKESNCASLELLRVHDNNFQFHDTIRPARARIAVLHQLIMDVV